MSDFYVGEIRIFAGDYAPDGWAICNGSTLSISGNEALYSLIGTTYGGDGVSNFKLPDLRGRLPVGEGQGAGLSNHPVGSYFGAESVALTSVQMPAHSHNFNATSAPANSLAPTPAGTMTLGAAPAGSYLYENGAQSGDTAFNFPADAMTQSGQGTAHENRMPVLAINYIIAITGTYPA
jgi:microcystin-dependent protein